MDQDEWLILAEVGVSREGMDGEQLRSEAGQPVE
jgi:hypothetical protein